MLSHAHIDHSGYLPLLVRRGFTGPVFCTPGTKSLSGLSAHADRHEILHWLTGFIEPPRQTYNVHGEPDAADVLQESIEEELFWNVQIANDLQTVSLLADAYTWKAPR